MAAHASPLALPARRPGPRAGPLSPGPRRSARPPALEKFTSYWWPGARRAGSSPHPLPTLRSPLGEREKCGTFGGPELGEAGTVSASWSRGRTVLRVAPVWGQGKVARSASQVYPHLASPGVCTQNPSDSDLGVCSPRATESRPSGPVLERITGQALRSGGVSPPDPRSGHARQAGLRTEWTSRGKVCVREPGLPRAEPLRPQLDPSYFRAGFPSSRACGSARFPGHSALARRPPLPLGVLRPGGRYRAWRRELHPGGARERDLRSAPRPAALSGRRSPRRRLLPQRPDPSRLCMQGARAEPRRDGTRASFLPAAGTG